MASSKLKYKEAVPAEEAEFTSNVSKRSWDEFRLSGLLWWINMLLHTFGWAIVVDIDTDTDSVLQAYPARVKFRGFDEKSNTEGYIKVANYINTNSEAILKEAKDE